MSTSGRICRRLLWQSIATAARKKSPVVWDEIPEEQLAQPGTITVRGDVDGATVEITVIVKSVLGVRDTRMVTRTGTVPTLPETVKVVYSDGTEQSMAVAWETITEEEVAQEGTITKLGTVEGIPEDMKATAYIRVGEQSVPGANVAVRAAGETYPKANASYNVGTGHNMSDSINDGTIAFSPSWNNWQNGGVGLEDSWVSVEFEEAYTISKVGVHFFTDGQTKEPRELIVQYSNDGADWTNVENQSKTSGFNVAQGDVNTEYSITFDAVNAKFIRLSMKGQVRDASTFKPVGISELKVYSDITTAPVPSSDATLTALQLNGEDLEGVCTDHLFVYICARLQRFDPGDHGSSRSKCICVCCPAADQRRFREHHCFRGRWNNQPLHHPVPAQRRDVGERGTLCG